jgi:hypothetical protein
MYLRREIAFQQIETSRLLEQLNEDLLMQEAPGEKI